LPLPHPRYVDHPLVSLAHTGEVWFPPLDGWMFLRRELGVPMAPGCRPVSQILHMRSFYGKSMTFVIFIVSHEDIILNWVRAEQALDRLSLLDFASRRGASTELLR